MLVQSSIIVCFINKLNRILTKMSIFRCQHRQSTTRRTIQGEGYVQVHQRRRGRAIIWGGRNHFGDRIRRSGRTGKTRSLNSDEIHQNIRCWTCNLNCRRKVGWWELRTTATKACSPPTLLGHFNTSFLRDFYKQIISLRSRLLR